MTAEHKYEMTISLQIVEHLGLNLYSNTSAVISEAVANAWDADAKTVEITLEKDCITIKDDGCGMDTDDINNKYLTVGYQKRHLVPITPMLNRKVMGRKGIGKLSLLSIAETITIYSSKNGQKNALQISTQKLREAVSQTQTYYPEEVDDSGIDFEGNGTKIVLTNLKKSRTTALAGKLKQRLARRFAVIGADKQFEVKVNGEPITISDRNYLTKAQYLWYYLRPADEDIPAQPADEYTKQCKSGVLRKSFSRSGELSIAGKPAYVYGWIATAPKPGDLDDDENINRIAIMVRGKMAKDDMLNEIGTTALYSKYIFGELNAEFLDTDEEADITTSSRQDFFDDDERYVVLKKFIESELAQIRADWEAERSEAGEEEACKYEVVREWYSGLIGDEKKAAKQLFGKINQLTVTPDEKKDIFKHGILAFESLKLKNELSALQDVQPDNLDIFLNVAGRLDSIEATYYYQIVKSRLAVIQRMKEVVHGDDLEKVIQRHLANNLWLLDPAWDRDTKLPSVEEAIKTQFDVINAGLTREEQEARLDVRYQKPSGKHVIIELKRGDRTVKFIRMRLNKVQRAAYELIQADARFLYTLVDMSQNASNISSNYIMMCQPYIGIFADGAEQWCKKLGLKAPLFNEQEKNYYDALRQSHKLLEKTYSEYANLLMSKLAESDQYFYSIRSLREKVFGYYNVGTDLFNGEYCGNTILGAAYIPMPLLSNQNVSIMIKDLSVIVGELAGFFGCKAFAPYLYDDKGNTVECKDFHFFNNCPLKEKNELGVVLFSILCYSIY